MGPASVRLIAQQCLQISAGGKLTQCKAQQLGLTRKGRSVEVQVQHAYRSGMLVDTEATWQRCFAHKSSSPRLAADQAHGLQFGIDTSRRDQGQSFPGCQLPVGGQACARCQPAFANFRG